MASEKYDQVVVDGSQDEHQLVLELRIAHGQVIGPFPLNPSFFEQKIECIDRHQKQPGQETEPTTHLAQLCQKPHPTGWQKIHQPRGGFLEGGSCFEVHWGESSACIGPHRIGRSSSRTRLRPQLQEFSDHNRRIGGPRFHLMLKLLAVIWHPFSKLPGLSVKLRNHAGEHPHHEHQCRNKNQSDGMGPRDTPSLNKIDDRIQQISQHTRQSQRPKDWRQDLQNPPRSPNSTDYQTQQDRDGQCGKRPPQDSDLRGMRRREGRVHVETFRPWPWPCRRPLERLRLTPHAPRPFPAHEWLQWSCRPDCKQRL